MAGKDNIMTFRHRVAMRKTNNFPERLSLCPSVHLDALRSIQHGAVNDHKFNRCIPFYDPGNPGNSRFNLFSDSIDPVVEVFNKIPDSFRLKFDPASDAYFEGQADRRFYNGYLFRSFLHSSGSLPSLNDVPEAFSSDFDHICSTRYMADLPSPFFAQVLIMWFNLLAALFLAIFQI